MKIFTKLHITLVIALFSQGSTLAKDTPAKPELDPSQEKWVKHYSSQRPQKPEQMLINTCPEPDLTQEFTPLFNGKNLTNWKQLGGKHLYEIKEGNIIEGTCVRGQPSSYLCTTTDYTDFIFTCDFKWLVDMNTGVLVRSVEFTPKNKLTTAKGPQIEMEGFEKPDRNWSGAIYKQGYGGWAYPLWLKQHTDARAAVKKDDWNRITIHVQGETIKTWINGKPAAHWINTHYQKGFIGLQVHSGKKGKVQFKNPRLLDISSEK